MAHRPVAALQGRIRRALWLLEELEDQLRVLGSSRLPRHAQVRSLAVARRRVRLAMAALGSRPDTLRFWGERSPVRQGWSLHRVLLEPAALLARVVMLLLFSIWRFMRAVIRLALTARAIWP